MVLACSGGSAQQLIQVDPLQPTDIRIEDVSDVTLETTFAVRLTNLSRDTVYIKWKKTVFDQPEDWITQMSDDNGIYLPNIESNVGPMPGDEEPLVLLPQQSTKVSMHILPLGSEGDGWYEISFYHVDTPGFPFESIDFNVMGGATASSYSVAKADISLYPNPATFYFEITPNNLVDEIELINVVGGKVRSYRYEHGQKYSISNLPSGLYLVRLINADKGVVKTVRLMKRMVRT